MWAKAAHVDVFIMRVSLALADCQACGLGEAAAGARGCERWPAGMHSSLALMCMVACVRNCLYTYIRAYTQTYTHTHTMIFLMTTLDIKNTKKNPANENPNKFLQRM